MTTITILILGRSDLHKDAIAAPFDRITLRDVGLPMDILHQAHTIVFREDGMEKFLKSRTSHTTAIIL